jgi:hypothetical protein
MKTRIMPAVIAAVIALLGIATIAFGDLGVSDGGERGTAVVHVADLTLQCTSGGTADTRCSMPADNAGWSVSESAGKVQFVINYKLVNQRPVLAQRFAIGYRVWRQDGNNWTLVADKANAVDKTVGANSNASGECAIPAQKMEKPGGTFKIAIRYDVSDVKTDYATRVLTVDRVL